MNNHQDWAYASPYPRSLYQQSSEDSLAVTRVTTTIALLVLGYYTLSFFELWPLTLKRRFHDTFVDICPPRLLIFMQSVMIRVGILGRDGVRFRLEELGSRQAKSDAFQQLMGLENNRITTAVRKARTFSGIERFLPPSTEIGPAGLGNWDNSCYQNSVLHGFASLPAFNKFVSKSWDLMRQKATVAPTHEALVGFLGRLNALDQPKKTLWTPVVLKSMDSWQQQDAQEYFSRVLDAVEKEDVKFYNSHRSRDGLEFQLERSRKTTDQGLAGMATTEVAPQTISSNAKVEKSAELLMRNPLDGMLAQSLKCHTCGFSEGLSLTQFNCITVNLGTAGGGCTLEQLLDEYTEPEDIDGVECTQCTKIANPGPMTLDDEAGEAKKKSKSSIDSQVRSEEAGSLSKQLPEPVSGLLSRKKPKPVLRTKSKQLTLGRLPEDLVIHLNRSIFDMYGNQRKNVAFVEFPLRLSILNRWCAPLDEVDEGAVQAVYTMQCAVTHAGRHDDGHYIAYAKRGKEWYCFNDETVTKVSEEFVFSRGNAFMLFYEIDHSPVSTPEKPTEVTETEDSIFQDALATVSSEEDEPQIPQVSHHPLVDIPQRHVNTAATEPIYPASEIPIQPSQAPTSPPAPETSAQKANEGTLPSSSESSSDTDMQYDSQHDLRPENILPPMRTASESPTLHRRIQSNHSAPVF